MAKPIKKEVRRLALAMKALADAPVGSSISEAPAGTTGE